MDSHSIEPGLPAVDFPVYGLDAGFQGARWVDFFEGTPGAPPWALWLGHREHYDDSGVRIGTFPRKRYAETMCPGGGDPLVDVAFSGAFGLVNLTLPDGLVPRPEGLILALIEHAEQQAERYRDWPVTSWNLDGESVWARLWHFAGAWAGFTDMVDDVYVVAVGIGVAPSDLRFARVTEKSAYGTNLNAPLSIAALGREKSARPEAWLPPPRRDSFHPDQLALVPTVDALGP